MREERWDDIDAVRFVNDAAFEQPDEGRIVDAVRSGGGEHLSLIAECNGEIVGHILFSRVTLVFGDGGRLEGMGLAPMAVLPKYQGRGIGSQLVREGLARVLGAACPFVVVLGHPEYYPRFGFERASKYQVRTKWDVPDDVFMMLWCRPEARRGGPAVAQYGGEFDAAM